MIQYRRTQEADWPAIVQLVNRVFQSAVAMEESFPLLFNRFNSAYVAVDSPADLKDSIVGFIGVFPETFLVDEKLFSGCRIGAVCVDKNYQGKQIGSQLFQFAKLDLAAKGAEYMLISGQGKLYLEGGAEKFGSFYHYTFSEKQTNLFSEEVKISELPKDYRSYKIIQELYQAKKFRYLRSAFDWEVLIQAQSLANLNEGKQRIFMAERETEKAVVIASICPAQKTVCNIIEFLGTISLLDHLLNHLLEFAEEANIWLPAKLEKSIERYASCIQEENAGTIVYFNPELKKVYFPHTWDIAFV